MRLVVLAIAVAWLFVPSASAQTGQYVTPEGVTIKIEAGDYSAEAIYKLLRAEAYQLDLIGPSLTVRVQDKTFTQASTVAMGSNGTWTDFNATILLDVRPQAIFLNDPEYTIAHEYGHVWTLYHLYLTQQANWQAWLEARGLTSELRLDSAYDWSRYELIAEDYRKLFASPTGAEWPYINDVVGDPSPALRDWFIQTWGPYPTTIPPSEEPPPPPPTLPPAAPQCSDEIDNDGDRRADFPADKQCRSPLDDDEAKR